MREQCKSYGWLIDSDTHDFYPDYFFINTLGTTPVSRLYNQLLSTHGGVFSMSNHIFKRIVHTFYDVYETNDSFFIDYDESTKAYLKQSRQWLIHRLSSNNRSMETWCLSEFYLFIDAWIRRLFEFICVQLPSFDLIKQELNQEALSLISLHSLKKFNSEPTFIQLLQITTFANWFDVVVKSMSCKQQGFFESISMQFQKISGYRESNELFHFLQDGCRNIVYECDNSGEIVFDLLMIQTLIYMGHSVVIVAKAAPILNDVTVTDVIDLIENNPMFSDLSKKLNTQELLVIAANDFPMIGKYLPMITSAYIHAYSNADLIWLKGQGNFQTMPIVNHYVFQYRNKYKKKIFFSFIVKAQIIRYCLNRFVDSSVKIGAPFFSLV